MSIDRRQFQKYVVEPHVSVLDLPQPNEAVAQLMAIAAWESDGGRYVAQIRGPAKGAYQMEPPTFYGLVKHLSQKRSGENANEAARRYSGRIASEMSTDLALATQMARWLLWFDPERLPAVKDRAGHYATYRRVWRPGKPPSEAKFHAALDEWR